MDEKAISGGGSLGLNSKLEEEKNSQRGLSLQSRRQMNNNSGLSEEQYPGDLKIPIDRKINFSMDRSTTIESYLRKWQECKMTGSNIQTRSYASGVIYKSYLYIYGGYEVNAGILGDFYRIKVNSDVYQWEKIVLPSNKNSPGCRCRHSALVYRDQMYLFGGQHKSSISENVIYVFDFEKSAWELIQYEGEPLAIDSHSALLHQNDQDGAKMIIVFGYLNKIGQFSNAVYQFDFYTKAWSVLSERNKGKNFPQGRVGSSAAIVNQHIYTFGGIDITSRLNDLWRFSLEKRVWDPITPKAIEIPRFRNGHSLISFQGNLFLFGGIHDVTWELDDLHMYNVEKNQWVVVDGDSARRKEHTQAFSPLQQRGQRNVDKQMASEPNTQQKYRNRAQTALYSSSPGQRNTLNTGGSKRGTILPTIQNKGNPRTSSTNTSQMNHTNNYMNQTFFENSQLNEDSRPKSPTSPNKTLIEQRRKEFLIKKANMLKLFEVTDEQVPKLMHSSPTSEAMKNALIVIGNPMPHIQVKPGKLTDFGRITISRFMEPLSNASSTILGKQPCARDGHVSVQLHNKLFIFGGDRHQMSFNDIYSLDLEIALKEGLDADQQFQENY